MSWSSSSWRQFPIVQVPDYPDASKLKKQFDFADKKGIGFLALVGTNEMASNAIPVKNLATGEQTTLDFEGILAAVKGH